ncbi:MAG: CotH kinase family protein [Phycisphaerales bacterium]
MLNPSLRSAAALLTLFWSAPALLAQETVYISEFMASNSTALADEDGAFSDWLELYNAGPSPVNLDGWYLTDNANNRTRWRIPAVVLAPGQHRIVWASNKNRSNPAAPLHTNFALSAGGEYLGLVRPDGTTVAFEYAPQFPPQLSDVSYGISTDAASAVFVAEGAAARALVPTNGNLALTWTTPGFVVPAAWLTGVTGVGYERATGYESLIGLNVNASMYNRNGSCYFRVPFTLASVPAFERLVLKMKYDDGFHAYLNGTRIASANAPASPVWNSVATAGHPDDQSVIFEEFDVTAVAGPLLVAGQNVLAIHGLNLSIANQDFLALPRLESVTGGAYQPTLTRFFTSSTPGALNGTTAADQGPAITNHAFSPAQPADADAVTVTARVQPTVSPVGTVSLRYRANYSAETTIPMLDNGASGDGAAGDGVYGAVIPAAASSPGQMLRWVVVATDTQARPSRLPLFSSPTQTPEYFGALITVPGLASQLPILHWWVQDAGQAATDTGTRCSLSFLGRFYDNIFVRLRGQSSSGFPKPHYKFDFNTGAFFTYDESVPPVEEFNLQTTYSDKAYIRQTLSWETYRDAGAAGCASFPMRVQQNGGFHSVAIFVEQPDEEYLTRNGLDNAGALYKMFNECTDANSGVEKKTREFENNSDLAALVAGCQLSGAALRNYLADHVDIPATISYIAASQIIHDNDHVAKNYYIYRDTEGSREWTMLPWDKDLTFGRNFGAGGGVLSDGIWADDDPQSHPLFGDQQHPKIDGPWNRFIDATLREPTVRQMYLRRLRTLMDTLLNAPGTPVAQRYFESRIDALVTSMQADVTLDRAAWGNPYGANQDFLTAVNILKNEYLTVRRTHFFQTHSANAGGIIPPAQSPTASVVFGDIERSPASGNQDEEYLALNNPGSTAVDISGWRLTGDIEHTFRPGTVIAPGGVLYCTPDVNTFRARTVGPRGGQGLFVQGNFSGHLASPPAELRLEDTTGRVVAIIAPCLTDFNGDGLRTPDDLDEYITSYFSEVASERDRCDFNGDGFVEPGDLDEFITSFFDGC